MGEMILTAIIRTAQDVPDDARVVAWFQEPNRQSLRCWIIHQSFGPVASGELMPEVELAYTSDALREFQEWYEHEPRLRFVKKQRVLSVPKTGAEVAGDR